MDDSSGPSPRIITTQAELEETVERARLADLVAVDVEGDGLFSYRAKLCTVQLGWLYEGTLHVAIVDTLAVSPAPLGPLLDERGPCKLLHDLTFDARLLQEVGIRLSPARDTSVVARLLGCKATGLSSLLTSELGLSLSKHLQQHDWSERPLRPAEVEYLANDVRYLALLDSKLMARAAEMDIVDEVEEESRYKLFSALLPPREKRAPYLRIKGMEKLSPSGKCVLKRLVSARERIAEAWDTPPFKVVGNEVLLELARKPPRAIHELSAFRGMSSRLSTVSSTLLEEVRLGLEDDPEVLREDLVHQPLSRAELTLRRQREVRLTAFRKAEAARRAVDEQVVLPGHCLQDLLAVSSADAGDLVSIPGLGSRRIARYGSAIAAILRGDPAVPVLTENG